MRWWGQEYPCTIVKDRYGGSYSGGKWTAWPLDAEDVPRETEMGDRACEMWWSAARESRVDVGVGVTPDEAFADLLRHMREVQRHG